MKKKQLNIKKKKSVVLVQQINLLQNLYLYTLINDNDPDYNMLELENYPPPPLMDL